MQTKILTVLAAGIGQIFCGISQDKIDENSFRTGLFQNSINSTVYPSTLSAAQVKLGWVYFNFSLYLISTQKKSWNEARQNCKTKGADLVIINSKDKQVREHESERHSKLERFHIAPWSSQEFLVEKLGRDKAWIGLHDKIEEGTWKWVDGTALTTA